MELIRDTIIVLAILWSLILADRDVIRDKDIEYDDTKFAETFFSSLLIKCDGSEGVCIQAGACQWNRVLPDLGDRCLEINSDYVCCKVAQVRMPVKLFEAYDM